MTEEEESAARRVSEEFYLKAELPQIDVNPSKSFTLSNLSPSCRANERGVIRPGAPPQLTVEVGYERVKVYNLGLTLWADLDKEGVNIGSVLTGMQKMETTHVFRSAKAPSVSPSAKSRSRSPSRSCSLSPSLTDKRGQSSASEYSPTQTNNEVAELLQREAFKERAGEAVLERFPKPNVENLLSSTAPAPTSYAKATQFRRFDSFGALVMTDFSNCLPPPPKPPTPPPSLQGLASQSASTFPPFSVPVDLPTALSVVGSMAVKPPFSAPADSPSKSAAVDATAPKLPISAPANSPSKSALVDATAPKSPISAPANSPSKSALVDATAPKSPISAPVTQPMALPSVYPPVTQVAQPPASVSVSSVVARLKPPDPHPPGTPAPQFDEKDKVQLLDCGYWFNATVSGRKFNEKERKWMYKLRFPQLRGHDDKQFFSERYMCMAMKQQPACLRERKPATKTLRAIIPQPGRAFTRCVSFGTDGFYFGVLIENDPFNQVMRAVVGDQMYSFGYSELFDICQKSNMSMELAARQANPIGEIGDTGAVDVVGTASPSLLLSVQYDSDEESNMPKDGADAASSSSKRARRSNNQSPAETPKQKVAKLSTPSPASTPKQPKPKLLKAERERMAAAQTAMAKKENAVRQQELAAAEALLAATQPVVTASIQPTLSAAPSNVPTASPTTAPTTAPIPLPALLAADPFHGSSEAHVQALANAVVGILEPRLQCRIDQLVVTIDHRIKVFTESAAFEESRTKFRGDLEQQLATFVAQQKVDLRVLAQDAAAEAIGKLRPVMSQDDAKSEERIMRSLRASQEQVIQQLRSDLFDSQATLITKINEQFDKLSHQPLVGAVAVGREAAAVQEEADRQAEAAAAQKAEALQQAEAAAAQKAEALRQAEAVAAQKAEAVRQAEAVAAQKPEAVRQADVAPSKKGESSASDESEERVRAEEQEYYRKRREYEEQKRKYEAEVQQMQRLQHQGMLPPQALHSQLYHQQQGPPQYQQPGAFQHAYSHQFQPAPSCTDLTTSSAYGSAMSTLYSAGGYGGGSQEPSQLPPGGYAYHLPYTPAQSFSPMPSAFPPQSAPASPNPTIAVGSNAALNRNQQAECLYTLSRNMPTIAHITQAQFYDMLENMKEENKTTTGKARSLCWSILATTLSADEVKGLQQPGTLSTRFPSKLFTDAIASVVEPVRSAINVAMVFYGQVENKPLENLKGHIEHVRQNLASRKKRLPN